MKSSFPVIALILFLTVSCGKKDDKNKTSSCGGMLEINGNRYNTAISEHFTIDTAYINQQCLHVTIGASACDASTWQASLIDEGVVMESYPVQRNIKLVLKNNEECLAHYTKTFAFDLQAVHGSEDKIFFNLENWNGSLLYEY